MSRYRSTRPDPRSRLTAPFLLRIAEIVGKREEGRFPFTLPFMRRGGFALDFRVSPAKLMFDRNFEQAQLLVTATDPAGIANERSDDLTTKASFASSNPAIRTRGASRAYA